MIEIVVSAALAVLAWVGVRVVNKVDALDAKVDALAEQHAGFEATLKNGLSSQVQSLEALIASHIDGEEERIVELVARQIPRGRVR